MADTIDLNKLDKRTAERYIQKGLVNEKDWEKHVKSLPDLAEKAVPIDTMMGDEIDDEDDEVESNQE